MKMVSASQQNRNKRAMANMRQGIAESSPFKMTSNLKCPLLQHKKKIEPMDEVKPLCTYTVVLCANITHRYLMYFCDRRADSVIILHM